MANYRNSEAWKRSIELTLEIYRATVRFPDEEMFGLTAQVRRAAIVAASRIAEGELADARKALLEIETQIVVAARLEYLQRPAARRLYTLARAAVKALDPVTPDRTSSGTA
jgi:four helix bundle protein